VIGIERDLMEELHETGANSGSLRCLKGTVENILPGQLPADAIILNPPRTGLSRLVAKLISDRGPHLAIYVSCDPATLARDLARLGEAYEIIDVHLFDLFPQTPHTETVAVMHRKV
jgi:23S rRNA (uracil1939-C5)-methyltransferase